MAVPVVITCHVNPHMQEEAERDPDMIVLWTAKEWASWPRGLSKAAARVMMDPIVMYSVMGPVMVLLGNFSCKQAPHRATTHTPNLC